MRCVLCGHVLVDPDPESAAEACYFHCEECQYYTNQATPYGKRGVC